MAAEVWLPIKDFEEYYEVSSAGRVRSKTRKTNNKQGKRTSRGRVLRPNYAGHGYALVSLCKDGGQYSRRIHRLVAEVFLPNPENKRYVNHKDLVKHHNEATNLEWVTPKENTEHAMVNGVKVGYYERRGDEAKRD